MLPTDRSLTDLFLQDLLVEVEAIWESVELDGIQSRSLIT